MEKKSMGSFIQALRKSKGLTQKEVAIELNVSDKTISKWERGDGYPEIMLLPALSELFDVTVDELLKGERIKKEQSGNTKISSVKKQVKGIYDRLHVSYANQYYIAFSLVIFAIVLQISVAYAFTKPTIGFALMVICLIGAGLILAIGTNKLHASYVSRDIFETDENLTIRYLEDVKKRIGTILTFSIVVFCDSLPFVVFRSRYYQDSVIRFSEYLLMAILITWLSIILANTSKHFVFKKINKSFGVEENHKIKKEKSRFIKRFAILTLIVYVITMALHIGISQLINNTKLVEYEDEASYESFIEKYDDYMAKKEKAKEENAILMDPRDDTKTDEAVLIVDDEKREYFYLVSEYELVKEIDDKNLTIQIKTDSNEYFNKLAIIRTIFLIVYVLEAYFLLILFLLKNRSLENKNNI